MLLDASLVAHHSSLPRRQAPVHLLGYMSDCGKKGAKCRQDVHLALEPLALAHIEDGVEARAIKAERCRQGIHCGALRPWRRLSQHQQRMAKQRGKGRNRAGHNSEQRLEVARHYQISLPQANQVGAQFAFDLQAMQARGHLEPGEKVFPEKHTMARLNIQQLNRKYISGGAQLVAGEDQRCRMALARPPGRWWIQLLQLRSVQAFQHAERSEERRVGKECRSRWSPYH